MGRTAVRGPGSNQYADKPPVAPREAVRGSSTAVPAPSADPLADDVSAIVATTREMMTLLDDDAGAVRAAKNRAEWNGLSPMQNAEAIAEGRRDCAELLGGDPQFVHFTDEAGAAGIVADMNLGCSKNHEDLVYAAAVGGRHVPGVQRGTESDSGFGYVKGGRHVAVVFRAEVMPDRAFVEECVWTRHGGLDIKDATIVPAEQAVALLDDSLGLPD